MSRSKAYYHSCPLCGCNLDPGERCDCTRETEVRTFGIISQFGVKIDQQNSEFHVPKIIKKEEVIK